MFFLIPVFAAVTLFGFLLSPDTERLITAGLQFVTIVLVMAHSRYVRRAVKPEVDKIAALTTRRLDEREHTTPPPEHVPGWDGTERRHP